MFRTIRQLFAKPETTRSNVNRTSLRMERLEGRDLMAVTQVLTSGWMVINSDNASDKVVVDNFAWQGENWFRTTVNGDTQHPLWQREREVTAHSLMFYGNGGDDTFDDNTGRLKIIGMGGDGNDTLWGGPLNDILWGGGNNDSIFGEGGDDELRGGDNNDRLDAGPGNDKIYGDAGDDTILDGSGADLIDGGSGGTNWVAGETGTAAKRNLYVEFDGASLDRATLDRVFAGNSGLLNRLDGNRNGINVSPLLPGRADRNQVIDQVMTNLYDEFSKFGVNVIRRSAGAKPIEGQGATTLYYGATDFEVADADLEVRNAFGVASSTDTGNRNATDVAFVHKIPGYSASSTEARYLANEGMHEVGHTFGLDHENVFESAGSNWNYYNEAMREGGQRFDDNRVASVTYQFLDRDFDIYGNTSRKQNSYRTLYTNLGLGTPTTPGPKGTIIGSRAK